MLKKISLLITFFLTTLIVYSCAKSNTSDTAASVTQSQFSVGGTVSGLSGTLVLQNNGGDDLNLTADGSYTFSTKLSTGAAYSVTIKTNPANQLCAVGNSNGTIAGANISNVDITCGKDVYVATTGDDSNSGSGDKPLKTINAAITKAQSLSFSKVKIAAGTYSVNYQSSSHVVVVEGISLLGGYSASNWADRDISDIQNDTAHQAVIKDSSSTGGSSVSTCNRALDIGSSVTSATVIEGLYIKGGDNGAAYTCGIVMTNSNAAIKNNYINGGGGTNTYGLAVTGTSAPTIENNSIIGGDQVDTSSTGIYTEGAPVIKNNRLDGGCGGGTNSYAIYGNNSAIAEISGNYIVGGTGGNAYGVYLNTGSATKIVNNTIHVNNTTNTSGYLTGFYLTGSTEANIINNVVNINGEFSGHGPYGFRLLNDSNTRIFNNTVLIFKPETLGGLTGISVFNSSSLRIENNNLLSRNNATGGAGISENNAGSDPQTVKNNNIHGFNSLYIDEGSTSITDVSTNVSNSTTSTLAARGNVSIDMGNVSGTWLFNDVDGADNSIKTTNDNNFRLTSSTPLNIREGGLNLSGESIFPVNGSSQPVDLAGTVRTAGTTSATNISAAGWSIGAYELD